MSVLNRLAEQIEAQILGENPVPPCATPAERMEYRAFAVKVAVMLAQERIQGENLARHLTSLEREAVSSPCWKTEVAA